MDTYPAITASTKPAHPGMTPAFFDAAVRRAFDAGLCIQKTSRASVVAVSSSTDADVSYLVTRETCSCAGAKNHGRCFHRALYLWWVWAVGGELSSATSDSGTGSAA
jgi:hypothetical protein